MTMADTEAGISRLSSRGGMGRRAMCEWTSSRGSLDWKGGQPRSTSYSVAPSE